jgi:hypothetical protein
MFNRLALLLGFMFIIPVAYADPKTTLYLPSAVGDKLVIEETRPTKEGSTSRLITRTVVSAEHKVDGLLVALREEIEGSPFQVNLYQQTVAGVFWWLQDFHAFKPPCCILRLPSKAGDTWELNDPTVFPRAIKFTTRDEEEVEVPAGKFKAIRIEKKSVLSDGKTIRVTEWAAAGIGTVKTRARLADGTEIIQVLKSFTPGKK